MTENETRSMIEKFKERHLKTTTSFRDLVIISALFIVVSVLVDVFGVFGTFQQWVREQPRWGEWRIHDYLFVFVILAFALGIFSLRRWIELRREILERKRVEEALRQAEEKYRSIFENAVEGIFQTRVDGRYLTANPALARIYGYESPEELMEAVSDLSRQFYVEPGRREEFLRLMQKEGRTLEFESQVYCKDGSVIWISESARAVRDAVGRLIGFEGTTIDITGRKRAEEALRESEERFM
ncbi:MAG: PAS domain S-box protein, partial [Bacteroidota bacterium]